MKKILVALLIAAICFLKFRPSVAEKDLSLAKENSLRSLRFLLKHRQELDHKLQTEKTFVAFSLAEDKSLTSMLLDNKNDKKNWQKLYEQLALHHADFLEASVQYYLKRIHDCREKFEGREEVTLSCEAKAADLTYYRQLMNTKSYGDFSNHFKKRVELAVNSPVQEYFDLKFFLKQIEFALLQGRKEELKKISGNFFDNLLLEAEDVPKVIKVSLGPSK